MRTNKAFTVLLPRILPDVFAPYTDFVVVLAMLFGGGTRLGLWSDVLVQLAALPLLPWAVVRLIPLPLPRLGRWAVILFGAIIALPLLQLVPLPPALWSALPGREGIAAAYHAAGVPLPWLPASLAAADTWRGLLSLLPAAAIFLATLSFGSATRRRLIALVMIVAFVSVAVDLLQMMGGPQSGLRFFTITNVDRAVGFFANANHHAALLYCAIPLACAWALSVEPGREQDRLIGTKSLLLFFVAVTIGISLTFSRAALLLALLAGISCLALVWRQNSARSNRRPLLYAGGAIVVALLVAFQFGFVGFVQKMESGSVMSNLRWPVAAITWQAARDFMPVGSGFGSFVPVYEMYAPRTLLWQNYINHAHNDWVELLLTGGLAAFVLAIGFLLWFVAAASAVWRREPPGFKIHAIALARAASIVIVLLLLHSIVDYPLRTIALSTLFALCCGLLIPAVARSGEVATDDHRRQHRVSGAEAAAAK